MYCPDCESYIDEIKELRARAVERLVHYCVCCPEQETPRDGCDCVCCTTARLQADLAEAEALLREIDDSGYIKTRRTYNETQLEDRVVAWLARRSDNGQ